MLAAIIQEFRSRQPVTNHLSFKYSLLSNYTPHIPTLFAAWQCWLEASNLKASHIEYITHIKNEHIDFHCFGETLDFSRVGFIIQS